ncbi:MAG: cyclase family protein [Anaerolineales bacterium]
MNDDIGALGAMTAASTLAALGLARQGRVFDLGVHLAQAMPHLSRDAVLPFMLTQFRTPASFLTDESMLGNSFSVEMIQGSIHQSSHLDSLIHAQRHGRVYGGQTVAALLTDRGWLANGIQTVPPIVSRAVVIDVATAIGQTPVPDGYAVTAEQMQAAVKQQGVRLQAGDTVLIRTGKIAQYASDIPAFEAGCPGISGPAARWLAEQGMMVFALDATSADPQPVPNWDDTVHEELLIKRGIHIIENLYLEDLAAEGIRECLFICLPLKIEGATGSWVRPVAIV